MAEIHLFTWNLGTEKNAHELTVDHLARRGVEHPFIACLQELPADSWIAKARRRPLQELESRYIKVVSHPKLARGIALVHHPALRVIDTSTVVDEDEEFIAAVFQRPSDHKRIAVIGVHAKSKVDLPRPEDHGGARALLRHAINALRLECDHQIVLGDFNSSLLTREIQSWYGFYALSSSKPLSGESFRRRRGFDHAPLFVVRPSNESLGTLVHTDAGQHENEVLDFIVVDEATRAGASAEILTQVAGSPVWDSAADRPNLSDHLPVAGIVDI